MAKKKKTIKKESIINMVYAGHVFIRDGILGDYFVDPTGKGESISCSKIKKSLYYIGCIVEIDINKDGMFSHKFTNEKHGDEEFINKHRLRSNAIEQEYKNNLANKKLKTESKRIDDMTLNDIKIFCKNSRNNKRLFRAYLEEFILW